MTTRAEHVLLMEVQVSAGPHVGDAQSPSTALQPVCETFDVQISRLPFSCQATQLEHNSQGIVL